jgi:hypothetical protein
LLHCNSLPVNGEWPAGVLALRPLTTTQSTHFFVLPFEQSRYRNHIHSNTTARVILDPKGRRPIISPRRARSRKCLFFDPHPPIVVKKKSLPEDRLTSDAQSRQTPGRRLVCHKTVFSIVNKSGEAVAAPSFSNSVRRRRPDLSDSAAKDSEVMPSTVERERGSLRRRVLMSVRFV